MPIIKLKCKNFVYSPEIKKVVRCQTEVFITPKMFRTIECTSCKAKTQEKKNKELEYLDQYNFEGPKK
jgi:hypothetical protein